MADVVSLSPSSPRNHSCISYSHTRSSSMPVFSSLRFNSSMESDGIGKKIVLELEEKEPKKGYIQPVQIIQFAETNKNVLFLQVNYEEHKSMCYTLTCMFFLFFRFYRGANGRLCSFSCTNATVKKFKDALAKHTTERCSLGPAKGLEESELLALSANKDLFFNYVPKQKPISVSAEEQLRERPNLADTELLDHLILSATLFFGTL
ncbi:hypothetical protein MKX01_001333 [Papaver californicum]|nr:hypothetical protein MKX01_001333 [Papaver californicum]